MKTITLVYMEVAKNGNKFLLIDRAFADPAKAAKHIELEQKVYQSRKITLLETENVSNIEFKTKELKYTE
jgi:hypothetical protein